MTRMEKKCTLTALFFVFLISFCVHAEGIRVRHASQGQSMALEINGEYWYQTIGDSLVIMPKNGGDPFFAKRLASHPGAATCSDILLSDTSLFVLLDGREVLTYDLLAKGDPQLVKRQGALSLGLIPHELLFVGDWPVVIGEGGAVVLSDGAPLVACGGNVTGIAMSLDSGLVYAMDDKLFSGDTNLQLGSATTIVELNDNADVDLGTLVYTKNLDGRTEVGLMDGAMRVINPQAGKIILDGEYRNLFVRRSRLIVVTDAAVYILGISPNVLEVLQTLRIEGVRDVDVIASNYLALCGEFGRGIYRLKEDRGGSGEQLIRAVYSTGAMVPGEFDLKGVLVPTGDSSLYYGFDQTLTPFESSAQSVQPPKSAVILGLGASIDPKIGAVIVSDSTGWKTILELPSPAKTLVPIDGNFWVGTQEGVYVFGSDETGKCVELASIILSGPILQLIPLVDGGAAFVSGAGVVGILELEKEPVQTESRFLQ
ncbi:MAG: hypothetical protein ISR75_03910 [Phycisphaerales bacterium]|nr:hypothetical protein [Phycisphaerales bacterium]